MDRQTRKLYKPADYETVFDVNIFKERLEQLLEQSDMTQATLANKLDLQPLTITRWKNGTSKNPVSYKYICQMAKIFDVEPEYLYDQSHSSPHYFQQKVSQSIDVTYEKYQPFISFMETLGITVDPVPMNKFIIYKDTDTENTYHEISNDELERLIRKIALFTEMQLL